MRKRIIKYGDSHVIRLSPSDLDVWNLEKDDIVDINLVKVNDDEDEDLRLYNNERRLKK